MEFPNPFGLSELVEKAEARYGMRELALLRRMYPELGDKTPEATAKLFDVNGKLLSVSSIAGLRETFSDLSASKVSRLLKDDQAFMSAVDELAKTTKAERRRSWLVLSALPLSEAARKHLENAFRDRTRPDSEPPAPESGESSEIVWIPMPAHLPYGNLPELETLLDASRKLKRAELPNADVYVIGPGRGFSQAVKLTNQETVAALQYVQGRLEHIKDERASLETKYRQANGLPKSSPVDAQEVKHYWLKRLTQKRLAEILEPKIGPLPPGATLEIRFTQYRREMPSMVRARVASSSSLRGFYQQQISGLPIGEAEQRPEAQTVEAGSVRVPAQIPMTEIVPFLDADTFVLKEEQPTQEFGPKKFAASKGREVEKMNELQRAYSEISRATKSGDWSKAIEIYVKYLEFWPQYLEHRMGVLDIWKKHQAGILSRLPKNILSIASGPHEELRAQWDIADILPGGEMPHVVQLDASQEMLGSSLATLPRGAAAYATDLVGDMREVAVGDEQFDMVECSSFDNLKNESDVKDMLAKAADRLAVGGVFRFMLNEPFTDQLCQVLGDHGFKVLDRNATVALAQETANDIKHKRGAEVLKRIQDKLKRHKYFTAIKTKPTDHQALREALEGVAVYKAKRKTSVALAREVRAAVSGEQKDQELDLATHLTVALNAPFFIQRRGLKPEELEFSLRALRGNLDTSSAIKLAQIFFTNPALSPYANLVFEAVKNVPEVVGNLSVLLLEHSNTELAGAVEPLMVARSATYFIPVLESGLGQETKTRVMKRMLEQPQAIAKLEAYLQNHDGQEIVDLMFPLLPKGTKLHLPLTWRFDERLSGTYRMYALDAGKGEKLTANEVEQLAQMESVPANMRAAAFDHLVDRVKSAQDPETLLGLAQDAVGYLRSNAAWLENHDEAVGELFKALEEMVDRMSLDAERIRKAMQLKRRLFGREAGIENYIKALRAIKFEERAKDMVSGVLDAYMRRRSQGYENELKDDLWRVLEDMLKVAKSMEPAMAAKVLANAVRQYAKTTDRAEYLKAIAAKKYDVWSKLSMKEYWAGYLNRRNGEGFEELAKNDRELAANVFDEMNFFARQNAFNRHSETVVDLIGGQLFVKYPELLRVSSVALDVFAASPDLQLPPKEAISAELALHMALIRPQSFTDDEFFQVLSRKTGWYSYERKDLDIMRQALDRDVQRALPLLPDLASIFFSALQDRMDKVLDVQPDFFVARPSACRPELIAEALTVRFEAVLSQIDRLPITELRSAISKATPKLSDEQLVKLLDARPDAFSQTMLDELSEKNSQIVKVHAEKLQTENTAVENFLRGPRDAASALEMDRILLRRPNLLNLEIVMDLSEVDIESALKWAKRLPLEQMRKAVVGLWERTPQVRAWLQENPDLDDTYDFPLKLSTVDPLAAEVLMRESENFRLYDVDRTVDHAVRNWLSSRPPEAILAVLETMEESNKYAMRYFDALAQKDLETAFEFAQTRQEFMERLWEKHAVALISAHPDYLDREEGIDVTESLATEIAKKNFSAAKKILEKLKPEEKLRVLAAAAQTHDEDLALEIWRDYPEVRQNPAVLGGYIQNHPFFLVSHRQDIPEDVRQDVRKRLQTSMARRILASFDKSFLQEFENTGLNNFPITYAIEQSDRNGNFVGYLVTIEGGIDVFVPGRLSRGLADEGSDLKEARLHLVPSDRQDRVVGELVRRQSNVAQRPMAQRQAVEAKKENTLEESRRSLLRRLVSRFDQRELASLEAQGLNYFSVKSLREQTRRQDGRRVGYMVSTDFGAEVFVPLSNVRVTSGDLRQFDRLEMRLQASHTGDRVVGIIDRTNPFRIND